MSRDLYPYYERELLAIRQLAQEFARLYPAAAGRLLLDPTQSTDPHVERMIEAFALIAGRIHHKLDDDFPELTDALFHVLYPHYLSPIPSAAVVQFVADAARTPLNDGFLIPRGSRLATPPVQDVPCKYQTTYPVTLWPIGVASAKLQGPPFPSGLSPPHGTAAVLRIQLEGQSGATFDKLSLDSLRFHLVGENQLVAELYELLLNNATRVVLAGDRPGAEPVVLAPSAITPVGFYENEALLPYPAQSFPGYRLMTEFFAYPAKFWFLDVTGFRRAREAKFGARCELQIYLSRTTANLEKGVEAGTFRLGCTPAINLFEATAEPISLTQARYEYRVVPETGHPLGMEIYTVDSVTGVDPSAGANVEYRPFYSIDHATGRGERGTFWYSTRRSSGKEDDRGTEVFLSLVDQSWQPHLPATSTLVVRTTCTNRNLASALQRAGDRLALQLEAAAPVSAIRCVRTPTMPLRPARRRNAHWRLLSHLSLNHLSLSDPVEGRAALQEILRLYDFSDPESGQQLAEVNRQLIEGLIGLNSQRVVRRLNESAASGFCRGLEVTVTLDEEKYVGTGGYLFASVLERFLGAYASINSFTQLVARAKQGEGTIRRWPPRSGSRTLI
ncbi:MAG TPA: type VI secretion system baseplate subunit TssF [Urbifossiella sp.]|nr:type VI secretion system baseplate subunit TssF [Urbifossiella sp.]